MKHAFPDPFSDLVGDDAASDRAIASLLPARPFSCSAVCAGAHDANAAAKETDAMFSRDTRKTITEETLTLPPLKLDASNRITARNWCPPAEPEPANLCHVDEDDALAETLVMPFTDERPSAEDRPCTALGNGVRMVMCLWAFVVLVFIVATRGQQ